MQSLNAEAFQILAQPCCRCLIGHERNRLFHHTHTHRGDYMRLVDMRKPRNSGGETGFFDGIGKRHKFRN